LITKAPADAFRIANTLDLEKHSALISVGGDGTFHEMTNGLLMRTDKKLIPVGLLPNGSGNDFGNCFKFTELSTALEHLVKGTTIKIDAVKVLIDHESEDQIKKE
jgi:diacylglycerol kinase family enzyme